MKSYILNYSRLFRHKKIIKCGACQWKADVFNTTVSLKPYIYNLPYKGTNTLKHSWQTHSNTVGKHTQTQPKSQDSVHNLNHNLFEKKGEPKRYRTEVLPLTSLNALPLGQTGSHFPSIPLRLSFLFKKVVGCGHCLVTLSITSY